MKKLLLASAAVAALSTSAFADDSMFYLRADGGYHMFNSSTDSIKSEVFGTVFKGKLKGKYSPSLEFGVGYNVMENLRAELVYSYIFNTKRKGTDAKGHQFRNLQLLNADNTADTGLDDGDEQGNDSQQLGEIQVLHGPIAESATIKGGLNFGPNASDSAKSSIQTIMVKGYYDVADLGFAQIFVGAGVGMSMITTKHSITMPLTKFEAINSIGDNEEVVLSGSSANAEASTSTQKISFKEKKKNNLTWSVALGAGFDVTDSIKVDVQYNYQDFGKSSGKIGKYDEFNTSKSKSAFRTHSIKLGARFAI